MGGGVEQGLHTSVAVLFNGGGGASETVGGGVDHRPENGAAAGFIDAEDDGKCGVGEDLGGYGRVVGVGFAGEDFGDVD